MDDNFDPICIGGVKYLNLGKSKVTNMNLKAATILIYLNINHTEFTELQTDYLKELQVLCANNSKLMSLNTANLVKLTSLGLSDTSIS